MTDFDELADSAECAGIHGQVLASWQVLQAKHPNGVGYDEIGVHAWNALEITERSGELPRILAAYVQLVMSEQHELQRQRDVRDSGKTFLDDVDVACLWDSLGGTGPDLTDVEVTVDAQALLNALAELRLLQDRARAAEGGAS